MLISALPGRVLRSWQPAGAAWTAEQQRCRGLADLGLRIAVCAGNLLECDLSIGLLALVDACRLCAVQHGNTGQAHQK